MNVIHRFPRGPRAGHATRSQLRSLATPAISDSLERSFGVIGVHPIGECLSGLVDVSMAGRAFTVRTRPGDNLAVHAALDELESGDVLIIDAAGEMVNAIMGELMTTYAFHRGAAGVVVDGAVRDGAALSRGPIPVFARGLNHRGPYKSGPGELHGLVCIGGVPVRDGDVVVGDGDGLVIIPFARLAQVTAAAQAVVEDEVRQRQEIVTGTWSRPWLETSITWVDGYAEAES